MPNWDYSGNGSYFLTIVTQNRVCNLGKILLNTKGRAYMELSDFGKIVKTEFLKSFEIRDELFLDEYTIMPNHLHAIIVLKKPETENNNKLIGSDGSDGEAHGRALQPPNQSANQSGFLPIKPNLPIRKPKSISSFFAGFKSSVNTKIDDYIDNHKLDIPKYNKKNNFFQSNYHDHIIRNIDAYYRIKQYIINNPQKWYDDKLKNRNTK